MKKFLLTAALVLALVVSLTAGTMAYYNVHVTTVDSNISTKSFVFQADTSSANYAAGVTIAPGDKAEYLFSLKNDSEVNTLATIDAELKNSLPGMKVEIKLLDSTASTSATVVPAPNLLGTASTSTATMADDAIDNYKVIVSWDYSNDLNNVDPATYAGMPNATTLSVTINGQQLADGTAGTGNGTGQVIVDETDGFPVTE